MEQYKVQRAVIVAAGFGTRLRPITINTPKPLIRVHGKRMIDGTLDALTEVGIKEIYIVRGYLKEQFDQLLYKYPMVKFIDNPEYDKANNIASAVAVGELLKNTYIIEGDLTLHNKKLIKRYQYQSNYCAIPVDKTDDWCLYQKDGYIAMAVFRKPGDDLYEYTQLFKRKAAIEEFQKRTDIEQARIYTKDAFVIADEQPLITQGEGEETTPNMGM